MSQYSDSIKDFGDQLTEGLERAQEFQLEQLRAWQTSVEQFGAVMPFPKLPENENIPSLETVVTANFKLAERILKTQRKFAMTVSELFAQPADESAQA